MYDVRFPQFFDSWLQSNGPLELGACVRVGLTIANQTNFAAKMGHSKEALAN